MLSARFRASPLSPPLTRLLSHTRRVQNRFGEEGAKQPQNDAHRTPLIDEQSNWEGECFQHPPTALDGQSRTGPQAVDSPNIELNQHKSQKANRAHRRNLRAALLSGVHVDSKAPHRLERNALANIAKPPADGYLEDTKNEPSLRQSRPVKPVIAVDDQLDQPEDPFSSPEQRALWKATLREIQSGKNKMFLRRRNPNGGVYYVLNNGREKNIKPKHDDADLFEISDLLLNLDALDQEGVREYGVEDEQALAQSWSDTQRRRDVRHTVRSMQHHVELARAASRKLLNQATHPMRVMEHDIMSVALRGASVESGMRQYEEDFRVKDEKGHFIVRGLTQSRIVENKGLPAAAVRSSLDITPAGGQSTELRRLINMGDPRKASDYMVDLRFRLGLPEYAIRDDERFLRWLLLHQSNIAFTKKDKKAVQKLDICKALKGQMLDPTGLKRRNLINIRRMIFQITDSGLFTTNLKGNVEVEREHSLSSATADRDDMQNVPLMLHNAVASVLDACGDLALHYEVLTFVNNLHIRFPDKPAMAMCKYGLRLRALAGVGLLDLARQHLQRYPKGIPPVVWAHGNVIEDVGAALCLWNVHADKNHIAQGQTSRRALFTVATGYNAHEKIIQEAYHDLLLRKNNRTELEGRLGSYMNFVELLGHLGAVRTLWYSWRVVQEMQNCLDDHAQATNRSDESVTDEYQIALANALQQGEPGAVESQDDTLETCARADFISIEARRDSWVSTRADEEHNTPAVIWIKNLSSAEFEEVMALPLTQWLQHLDRSTVLGAGEGKL